MQLGGSCSSFFNTSKDQKLLVYIYALGLRYQTGECNLGIDVIRHFLLESPFMQFRE